MDWNVHRIYVQIPEEKNMKKYQILNTLTLTFKSKFYQLVNLLTWTAVATAKPNVNGANWATLVGNMSKIQPIHPINIRIAVPNISAKHGATNVLYFFSGTKPLY